jgi:hypothetical protein
MFKCLLPQTIIIINQGSHWTGKSGKPGKINFRESGALFKK